MLNDDEGGGSSRIVEFCDDDFEEEGDLPMMITRGRPTTIGRILMMTSTRTRVTEMIITRAAGVSEGGRPQVIATKSATADG